MPRYTFTGAYPRALFGLTVGVNAKVTKADGYVPVIGSTVEASTGDVIETTEPYKHPDLTESEPAQPAVAPEVAPAIEVAPEPAPAAPVGFDPAHDAMTAEGAPAPAATN